MSSANNAIAMIDVKKPRKQMTEEAKVAMAAKRAATLAAKQSAAPVPAPAPAPEEQEAEGEDGKKARKPREKMTETAKAAMAAKRAATLAAKKGTVPEPAAPAPAPAAEELEQEADAKDGKKARKPREKMTDEAKAAMAAKRALTLAAKKGTAAAPEAEHPSVVAAKTGGAIQPDQVPPAEDGKKARKPREKMTETAKAAMAAKRAATLAAKNGIAPALVPTAAPVPEAEAVEPKATTPPAPKGKKAAPGAPKKGKKEATPAEDKPMSAPKAFTLVEVDGSFFMVHNESQKVYRANLDKEGDDRAEMDQQAGLFKDGEILPIFDEDE